jgi:hypothetical protein
LTILDSILNLSESTEGEEELVNLNLSPEDLQDGVGGRVRNLTPVGFAELSGGGKSGERSS